MKTFYQNKQGGFTILFASLIGSLVMAIGMAILAVTIMQINLSSAGRESQHAFYAADTGTECALYLNFGGGNAAAGGDLCPDGVFPRPGGGNNDSVCLIDDSNQPFTYKCQNKNISFVDPPPTYDLEGSLVTSFEVNESGSPQNTCFVVTVTKKVDQTTSIESRGYSTCDTNNPNRFERAINTTNF